MRRILLPWLISAAMLLVSGSTSARLTGPGGCGAWVSEPIPTPEGLPLISIADMVSDGEGEVWALGRAAAGPISTDPNEAYLIRFSGGVWQIVDRPDVADLGLAAVHLAADRVWLGGSLPDSSGARRPVIFSSDLDTVSWTELDLGQSHESQSQDDRSRGGLFQEESPVDADRAAGDILLANLKVFSQDDLWFSAVRGEVGLSAFHWDGKALIRYDQSFVPMIPIFPRALDGASSDDLWLVGYRSDVFMPFITNFARRWDGSTWSSVDVGVAGSHDELNGVVALAGADVRMAGFVFDGFDINGIGFRWDGTEIVNDAPTLPVDDMSPLGLSGGLLAWGLFGGSSLTDASPFWQQESDPADLGELGYIHQIVGVGPCEAWGAVRWQGDERPAILYHLVDTRLFADGFESGDTSAWSESLGEL